MFMKQRLFSQEYKVLAPTLPEEAIFCFLPLSPHRDASQHQLTLKNYICNSTPGLLQFTSSSFFFFKDRWKW